MRTEMRMVTYRHRIDELGNQLFTRDRSLSGDTIFDTEHLLYELQRWFVSKLANDILIREHPFKRRDPVCCDEIVISPCSKRRDIHHPRSTASVRK